MHTFLCLAHVAAGAGMKRKRCGDCDGCQATNCGECANCLDKKDIWRSWHQKAVLQTSLVFNILNSITGCKLLLLRFKHNILHQLLQRVLYINNSEDVKSEEAANRVNHTEGGNENVCDIMMWWISRVVHTYMFLYVHEQWVDVKKARLVCVK